MAIRFFVGMGCMLIVLGGGLYLTQQNALQMAVASFQPSVQQYVSESIAVGLVITQLLVGLGAVLIVLGMMIGIRRMIQRRVGQAKILTTEHQ